MPKHDIIVIGGSAGSTAVLQQIASELPADLQASVFVVTHTPPHGARLLAGILDGAGPLSAGYAEDGEAIVPGRIYVGPPNSHLLLEAHTVTLGAGPRENMARPSIDPLFRSAALHHGSRVIGVILSGMMDDGAAGLVAIKQQNGVAVVQDPATAEAAGMPLAALAATEADAQAPPSELAAVISRLSRTEACPLQPIPDALSLEVEVASGRQLGSSKLGRFAQPSPLSCPDCGGVLSEFASKPLRYRCQIGHAYSAEMLKVAQADELTYAISMAMRIIVERANLTTRLWEEAVQAGRAAAAASLGVRATEYREQAELLKRVLVKERHDRMNGAASR